jgi:hypothetical protein
MTNIRAQAAKEAREWAETHGSTACMDYNGQIACAAGYLLGHAAGVEEGARRFAEWCFQRTVNWVVKSDLDVEVERFLAALASGTGAEDGEKEVRCAACHRDWPNEEPK